MKNNSIFITSEAFFESTNWKNPINCLDHKMEHFFPDCYSAHYDTRLLVAKKPTKEELDFPVYNDYRERFGSEDIRTLDAAIMGSEAKNILLNSFSQDDFLHVAPLLKDSAEIIFFFKCPKIHDLSVLSEFSQLKCVHIFWNNSLESLWDMTRNKKLKVLSFLTISKLSKIEALKQSSVEYITFSSSYISSNQKKKALFDTSVFAQMKYLKHLSLTYSHLNIDY